MNPAIEPVSSHFNLRYEEAFRHLRLQLHQTGLDLNKVLKHALEFLGRHLPAAHAAVFLADFNRNLWRERMRLMPEGFVEKGYRQESMREAGVFQSFLASGREIWAHPSETGEPMLYVLVRLDMAGSAFNAHSGESLWELGNPRFYPGVGGIAEFRVPHHADLDLLVFWCREVSPWLSLALMQRKLDKQSRQIKAFGELSWLFVTSLRLEDRLKLIIEGIQKMFSFDRIRLYLVNPDGTELVGEFESNIRREITPLDYERYPLEPGQFRGLVEILWNNLRLSSWSRILEYSLANHDKMLYLPLKIQGKEIGVLVVDNLLSQKSIEEEVRNLLQSFAGQLSLAVDNARLFSEVERLSLYDSLSHLPNRRYFDQRLQEEFYRSARGGLSFAVCLIDLDFFKEINDTYGHQIGDQAIARIGAVIKSMLRQSDFAARWGGDELAVLLGNTGEEDALVVADRLMTAIRDIRLNYPSEPPKEIKLTASMGIAIYPKDAQDVGGLIAEADRALYEVKFKGRDNYLLASRCIQTTNG